MLVSSSKRLTHSLNRSLTRSLTHLLTSSGLSAISIKTNVWEEESTHPPRCTSSRRSTAPCFPRSSGRLEPRSDFGSRQISLDNLTPVVLSLVSMHFNPGEGPHPCLTTPDFLSLLPDELCESVAIQTSGKSLCKTVPSER